MLSASGPSGRASTLCRIAWKMVSKALGLPEGIIPLNIICIGHPDSDNPAKDKWDPAKVHYNMF